MGVELVPWTIAPKKFVQEIVQFNTSVAGGSLNICGKPIWGSAPSRGQETILTTGLYRDYKNSRMDCDISRMHPPLVQS